MTLEETASEEPPGPESPAGSAAARNAPANKSSRRRRNRGGRGSRRRRTTGGADASPKIRIVNDLTRDAPNRQRSRSRVFAGKQVPKGVALDPAVVQVGRSRTGWVLCPAEPEPAGRRRQYTPAELVKRNPLAPKRRPCERRRRPCDAPAFTATHRRPTGPRKEQRKGRPGWNAARHLGEVRKWTGQTDVAVRELQRRVAALEHENASLRFVKDLTHPGPNGNFQPSPRLGAQPLNPRTPVFQSVLIDRPGQPRRGAAPGKGGPPADPALLSEVGPLTNHLGKTDLDAVQRQLEYYFGETNLVRDAFIRSQMDVRGFVRVSVLAAFPRMQGAMVSPGDIAKAAKRSPMLELNLARDAGVRNKKLWKCFADPTLATRKKSRKPRSKASKTEATKADTPAEPADAAEPPAAPQGGASDAADAAAADQESSTESAAAAADAKGSDEAQPAEAEAQRDTQHKQDE